MRRFFVLILIVFNDSCQGSRHFSLKTGASVTIPCSYDRRYVQYNKYWCRGATFNSCTIQAFANDTKGKVTVTDHPAERFFTVTMDNLQAEDTGWYYCAVEIVGPDVNENLHITVKSDPDLYVMENRVRGEEGGNVTVQCLYSAAYRNEQKRWCRFRDPWCNTDTKIETSRNSVVQLSDDGKSSFTVRMSKLKKSDAGWYWCSAGDLQIPLELSVSDPPPVTTTMTTAATTTPHLPTDSSIGDKKPIHWYLLAVFFLLVILLVIITFLLRKKFKVENQTRTDNRDRSNGTTVHTPTFTSEDSAIYSNVTVSKPQPTLPAEDTMLYSTVVKPKMKSSASNDQADNEHDVMYSVINITSNNKTVSPNNGVDETVYSSVV